MRPLNYLSRAEKLLLDWRKEVVADMPEENPSYKPGEPFEGAISALVGKNQIKEK